MRIPPDNAQPSPSSEAPQPIVTRKQLHTIARIVLGCLATIFFLLFGLIGFGHKCMAGNKTLESVAPWALAALALGCVIMFRRIWLALIALVLLFIAAHFVTSRYLDAIHRGQPEEHENAA